jgi:ferrous iron transport protein B
MEFILVGQPNCGKSTIFNGVVGYKSEVANFPGTTMNYTKGSIFVENMKMNVVDIPGTYSLQTTDETELDAVEYLLNSPDGSVIINVIDASVLSRSLELTLQLMELKVPMIIALNMVDESDRKGIQINMEKLSTVTGLPIVKTNGKKGEGISELFKTAFIAGSRNTIPKTITAPFDVEKVIKLLMDFLKLKKVPQKWNYRLLVLKLIEKDNLITRFVQKYLNEADWEYIKRNIVELEQLHQRDSELIISAVRHNLAFKIFEEVARIGLPPKRDIREKMDGLLMHPFLGYVFMFVVLYMTFSFIFSLGNSIEPLISGNIEKLNQLTLSWFGKDSILFSLSNGVIQGFGGGLAIVIPFLIPFFVVFSILEDTGYLARIAYLIDNIMHRIGLHGMSVVPMILGYGCTVPGIFATRILKSRRDKLITATLTTLVPCSARMIIIIGVAGSISLKAAGLIYVINIILLGITGKLMSLAMPEVSPGLLLEIPKYHMPTFKVILQKTWFRMKEFVVIAWPLLIAGSIVLEIINFFGLSDSINQFLSPFTSGILGLPAVVGVIFLFGILRKELVLIMLITALGTKDIANILTQSQIFTFTIFSTFYIPCLATFAALLKELKLKNALLITGLTMMIAVMISVLIRIIFPIFGKIFIR